MPGEVLLLGDAYNSASKNLCEGLIVPSDARVIPQPGSAHLGILYSMNFP